MFDQGFFWDVGVGQSWGRVGGNYGISTAE